MADWMRAQPNGLSALCILKIKRMLSPNDGEPLPQARGASDRQ
jgi:hypothetical protein